MALFKVSNNDHREPDAQLKGESDGVGELTSMKYMGSQLLGMSAEETLQAGGKRLAESITQAKGRAGRWDSLSSPFGSQVSDTLGTAKSSDSLRDHPRITNKMLCI